MNDQDLKTTVTLLETFNQALEKAQTGRGQAIISLKVDLGILAARQRALREAKRAVKLAEARLLAEYREAKPAELREALVTIGMAERPECEAVVMALDAAEQAVDDAQTQAEARRLEITGLQDETRAVTALAALGAR